MVGRRSLWLRWNGSMCQSVCVYAPYTVPLHSLRWTDWCTLKERLWQLHHPLVKQRLFIQKQSWSYCSCGALLCISITTSHWLMVQSHAFMEPDQSGVFLLDDVLLTYTHTNCREATLSAALTTANGGLMGVLACVSSRWPGVYRNC